MEEKEKEIYEELARRLSAAFVSWRAMNKSIDYTMEKYCSGDPGELWLYLAKYVDDVINKAQSFNEKDPKETPQSQ